MGNTFRFWAGGVDAVESEFGDGRAPAFCRPRAGWRGDDGRLSGVRHLAQNRLQNLPPLPGARAGGPDHDRDIVVTNCGRLCLHRKKINISTMLAGQKLGIREVDEGIWLVSFMHYDLGYFDLEQKTLQPLGNPFGTRLSPMS
jgi:hypothetical protein